MRAFLRSDSRKKPEQVASNVAAVSTFGDGTTLYIMRDGRLLFPGFLDSGGDGANMNMISIFKKKPKVLLYANGKPVIDAKFVVAGGYYSLHITKSGNLWGRGYNANGELGDGTVTFRNRCVPVASNVTAVAASHSHSLYVTRDGKLWAMGFNANGQLGDGSVTNRITPVQVATSVTAVAAGNSHSLFATADGKLWAMGFNGNGELGDGTTRARHTPVQIRWAASSK